MTAFDRDNARKGPFRGKAGQLGSFCLHPPGKESFYRKNAGLGPQGTVFCL